MIRYQDIAWTVAVFTLTVSLGQAVVSAPAAADSITVTEARAEMMEGQTARGDIFMTITNTGAEIDWLYAVRTEVAQRATLETESEAAVLEGKQSETSSLAIPPGGSVHLTEEGAHIELYGLARPMEEGETFTSTLFFENAGAMEITVKVGEE